LAGHLEASGPLSVPTIEPSVRAFIAEHRVARLATSGDDANPHVIPVCYAFDGVRIYSALDLKPKRVEALRLKRVRNIVENPSVAFVVDDYSENWDQLAYVLVHGKAAIVTDPEEQTRAENMLRAKYPQYRELLEEGCVVLRIDPERVVHWGRIV